MYSLKTLNRFNGIQKIVKRLKPLLCGKFYIIEHQHLKELVNEKLIELLELFGYFYLNFTLEARSQLKRFDLSNFRYVQKTNFESSEVLKTAVETQHAVSLQK